jgi:hypothetical protein
LPVQRRNRGRNRTNNPAQALRRHHGEYPPTSILTRSIADGHLISLDAYRDRISELTQAHLNDLGGDEVVSYAERCLVERSATLTLQMELLETSFALRGREASPDSIVVFQRSLNTLRRTFQCLGLSRRPRDVTATPTLEAYLSSKQQHARQEPDDDVEAEAE